MSSVYRMRKISRERIGQLQAFLHRSALLPAPGSSQPPIDVADLDVAFIHPSFSSDYRNQESLEFHGMRVLL